jgi:hypothetical protein
MDRGGCRAVNGRLPQEPRGNGGDPAGNREGEPARDQPAWRTWQYHVLNCWNHGNQYAPPPQARSPRPRRAGCRRRTRRWGTVQPFWGEEAVRWLSAREIAQRPARRASRRHPAEEGRSRFHMEVDFHVRHGTRPISDRPRGWKRRLSGDNAEFRCIINAPARTPSPPSGRKWPARDR